MVFTIVNEVGSEWVIFSSPLKYWSNPVLRSHCDKCVTFFTATLS